MHESFLPLKRNSLTGLYASIDFYKETYICAILVDCSDEDKQ